MAGSSHKAWLRKGHHLPWSWPPPPSAPLWLPPISSLSAADKREPRCIAGESSGSPQSTRGLQTFFGRASVAVASPGPCGPREAAALPRARNPPHPTPPSFLYCVHMFDRHRTHNNLFPAGSGTICLSDPTNSFNPFSCCHVPAAVAHRRRLINAASLFIPTSSFFVRPSPPSLLKSRI